MYKKSRLCYYVTFIIAILMAMVFATHTPIQTVAAAKKANRYLSEVIIIREDQVTSATNDGYSVLMTNGTAQGSVQNPLYTGSDKNSTNTYLAYKTTTDPNEAITDIRFMNMKGGFSFEEYTNLLNGMRAEASKTAASIWPAIAEFRENYAVNHETAIYAKEQLDIFVFDDIIDEFGTPIKLGDLLLDESLIPDKDSEYITTLFLESNYSSLNSMYDALAIACSKNLFGNTLLTNLSEMVNPAGFYDRTDLNDVVNILVDDADRLKESIAFYEGSEKHYEDFDSEEEAESYVVEQYFADEENGTDCYSKWLEGYTAKATLSAVPYHGINLAGCNTLYDFIINKNRQVSDWYPLVACMSEGTKACAFLGLVNLVKDAQIDIDHIYDGIDFLNEVDAFAEIVEEGISVFEGVDREIYREGMVAMTGSAVKGSKSDDSWQRLQDEAYDDYQKQVLTKSIMLYSSIGIGGLAVASGSLFARFTKDFCTLSARCYTQAANISTTSIDAVFPELTDAQYEILDGLAGELEDLRSAAVPDAARITELEAQLDAKMAEFTGKTPVVQNVTATTEASAQTVSKTAVVVSATMLAIAVIMLIVTLVLYFLLGDDPVLVYEDYTEIPAILCDYRPIYVDDKIDNDTYEYVYYKVAQNPYGVASESLFGDNKQLPENKKPAQDIYNWELKGYRQWLCLYTTKDVRAGLPILANSLKIDGEKTVSGSSTVSLFDTSDGLDLALFYNSSISRNPYLSASEIRELSKDSTYLHFTVDTTAKRDGYSANQKTPSNAVASAVSNGAAWGMAIIFLAVGFVCSFIIARKKQKNS